MITLRHHAISVSILIVLATVSTVMAQTTPGQPPAASKPDAAPKAGTAESPRSAPAGDSKPDVSVKPDVNVNIDRRDAPARSDGDSGGSALPRASVEREQTIFGLSPLWAAVIGLAILIVVILAIVSMSRSSDIHVDHR
jgi:hypothetical protein